MKTKIEMADRIEIAVDCEKTIAVDCEKMVARVRKLFPDIKVHLIKNIMKVMQDEKERKGFNGYVLKTLPSGYKLTEYISTVKNTVSVSNPIIIRVSAKQLYDEFRGFVAPYKNNRGGPEAEQGGISEARVKDISDNLHPGSLGMLPIGLLTSKESINKYTFTDNRKYISGVQLAIPDWHHRWEAVIDAIESGNDNFMVTVMFITESEFMLYYDNVNNQKKHDGIERRFDDNYPSGKVIGDMNREFAHIKHWDKHKNQILGSFLYVFAKNPVSRRPMTFDELQPTHSAIRFYRNKEKDSAGERNRRNASHAAILALCTKSVRAVLAAKSKVVKCKLQDEFVVTDEHKNLIREGTKLYENLLKAYYKLPGVRDRIEKSKCKYCEVYDVALFYFAVLFDYIHGARLIAGESIDTIASRMVEKYELLSVEVGGRGIRNGGKGDAEISYLCYMDALVPQKRRQSKGEDK